ncbi:MAG: hypothetical protein U1E76_09705 [Planctomycetota bacterium]
MKLAPLVFFLAACIVLLIGCDASTPSQNVARAEQLVEGGDSAAALALADGAIEALAKASNDPDALFRAHVLRCRALAESNAEKAFEEWQGLVNDNPKAADAAVTESVVRSLRRTREGQGFAVTAAERAKQRFPDQSATFDAILQDMSNDDTLSGAARDKLKALGYIGASKKDKKDAKPTPAPRQ